MIHERQAHAILGLGDPHELVEALPCASHPPMRIRDLLALLPIGRRPDVLGVRRKGKPAPGQYRGVARDGCRGMQIVHMQMVDVRRKLAGKDAGLAEPASSIGAEIARKIAKENPHQARKTRQARRVQEAAQHAQRFLIKIFRQVVGFRPHGSVERMHGCIGGPAQRPDVERKAETLERQQLLRDESLRKARIPLDDHREARGAILRDPLAAPGREACRDFQATASP